MNVKNLIKTLFFSATLVFLFGCDVMDTILPSSGTYKVSARVNDIPLDECSFIGINDIIYPYFEESVLNDPDVTALMVFIRNSKGDVVSQRIVYSIEDDFEPEGSEEVVFLNNFDDIPPFPMPVNLNTGRYVIVSQVMSGRDVLQRTEKPFYYMGNTDFIFEGIDVHLPGVTDTTQLIPRGMIVMLEAKFDKDSRMDPYIIWYNGRKKISEGKLSDGAGFIFWEAPEQSGFYSISAEVYPIDSYVGLAGYQKEVSLLVSSRISDVNLVSENIPQLIHWYVFENSLNDSKIPLSAERAVKPSENNSIKWMSADGIYGLASGYNNYFALPNVLINNKINESNSNSGSRAEPDVWQTLFRFKPINDGVIFSIQLGSLTDSSVVFSLENKNLVLTLVSPSESISQTVKLPEYNSFITAGINFSILPGVISAKINILGDSIDQGDLAVEPISVETIIFDNFRIFLGQKNVENAVVGSNQDKETYTILWDEFALYNKPPMEVIAAEIRKVVNFYNPEHEIQLNSETILPDTTDIIISVIELENRLDNISTTYNTHVDDDSLN